MTMRMPTMAPVPRPEPPPVASDGARTGRGETRAQRARKTGRRGVRRERKGWDMKKRGAERKLERQRGRDDDEECSQAEHSFMFQL